MLPQHEHIKKLWQLYVTDQASQDQVKELFSYLKDPGNDSENDQLFRQVFSDVASSPASYSGDKDEAWQAILMSSDSLNDSWKTRQDAHAGSLDQEVLPVNRRFQFFRTAWFRYAAAIIILLGTATYLFNIPKETSQKSLPAGAQNAKTDIVPGGNRAFLTLADGSTIILDSAVNGTLAQQGNAQVVKLSNGQIVYNLTSPDLKETATGSTLLNTMRTPRGGQYQLTLPDGTRVWLNAESSVTYPAVFTGRERNVKVTGEAYFEVSKNKAQPFIVDVSGRSSIEVLGTHFNVNSYTNEDAITTTLLEGSVRMNASNKRQMLKPGQQAVIAITPSSQERSGSHSTAQIKIVEDANIEKAMAWKNGVFDFEGASLAEVMRQITRWYDIEVIYERGVPEIYFGGKMSRSVSLSGLLKGLEGARVHFRIEGRKLIVLP